MRERTGITDVEADQAAWTVLPDGGRVGGARAAALAIAVGRQASWPVFAWKIPGCAWVLDRVYELVARYRYRLPGDTPWCVEHPDECSAQAE